MKNLLIKAIVSLLIVLVPFTAFETNIGNIAYAGEEIQETKRLQASEDDRMVFGVCGGLGEYFGVDSQLIRVGFAVSLIFFGTGAIVYLILAFIMNSK